LHSTSKEIAMHRSDIRLVVSGLIVAFGLAGCDAVQQVQQASQQQQMMNNLKQLGLAYHQCHDAMQRGPQSWMEAEQNSLPAPASAELQNRGYVVHWGVKFKDVLGGTSNFIAAYPPDAATAGGACLFMDGSVRQMTAQEFTSALAQQAIDSPQAMAAAAGGAGGAGGATAPATESGVVPLGVPSGPPGPPGPPAP
jgi:hypothetical protein